MDSVIWKVVLISFLIGMATLASRRWGEAVAGWIIGLPLKSAPTSVFFALEQGPAFAADAARGTLLGLTATAAFCIGYALSAKKAPEGKAGGIVPVVAGLATYLLVGWGLSMIAPGLWVSALMVVLTLVAALALLGKPPAKGVRIPPPWWDLPLRIISALALVLILTGAAKQLGPRWSGMLSPFPVFTFVMSTFAYSQGGPTAALHLVRGVLTGLFAFTAFFVIVSLLVDTTSLLMAYGVATVTALGINALSLNTLIHKGPAASPTSETEIA